MEFSSEETVDSTTFTINYIASLATDGRRRLDRVMILHVDPNRDRSVTREEALGFRVTNWSALSREIACDFKTVVFLFFPSF